MSSKTTTAAMGSKTMAAKKPPASREEASELSPVRGSLPRSMGASVVFIASGAVLVLEILSVRLLAPYVGLTLETTTSIIGAVLAGIAGGAALGGWLADRVDPHRLLVALLIGGGLLVLLTVPIIRALGPSASEGGNLAAVGVTFAALVPLAAVLSGVTPTVARLQLRDLRASGTVVGRLSGWATAGALIGTFGTGFVLVPLLPVSSSILAIGGLLLLTGFLLAVHMRMLSRSVAALTLLGTAGLAALTLAQRSPCQTETAYNCVQTAPDGENPHAEVLMLNRGYNSDVDPSEPSYLGFRYERWIAEEIDGMAPPREPLRAVFVGGGAFTLPRWLAATRPGSRSNTLEVDGGLVEFDRNVLALHTTPDLRATVGDARLTMRREPAASADAIVGDAFSSRTVPWQLMTTEWLGEVKRVLRPHGIYTLNMIDLRPLALLRAETATLLRSFANVRLVTPPGGDGRPEGGNEVLVASNGRLPLLHGQPYARAVVYERAQLAALAAGAEPLRDDYAPVDQLETR